MYNRYLPEAVPDCAPARLPQKDPGCAGSPGLGGLSQLLGGRLHAVQIDADTLIAAAVIWFLLSDGEISQTDLIIIAVLFLLGL